MNHLCDYCHHWGPKEAFPLTGLPWLPTEDREVKVLPNGKRRCLGCASELLTSDEPLRRAVTAQANRAEVQRRERANPETFAEWANSEKCRTNQDDQGSDLRKCNRGPASNRLVHTSVPLTNKSVVRVPCRRCSKPFDRPVRRGRPQVYCGPECAREAANRQRQGKPVR